MPAPLTLPTPGRWGVNEQERNQLLHPNWATIADSLVINDSGNIQCRGGLNLISTDGAPSEILRQFVYVNSAGNETVISTTATKIISGVGDLDDTSTDITPTGAPTNGYWQFQNFNGKVVGWQASHTPIVWSGSGDFATITAASGTLPDGDCVLSAFGRLWAVDDDGQTVRYSALLDETRWHEDDGGGAIDMRNVWPKGMDRVQAIAAFGANLIIFGRRQTVVYTDGSGSTLGIDPTQMYVVDTIDTGCVCRDSVTIIGEGDLVFLSEVGLQSLGRVIASKDNPLATVSWQIADRLAEAIQTEIASATDLRTWTGAYIPATGQYMLTHTTTEDVYVFHFGGAARDEQGRPLIPITIWDTSILLNIRGFVTRRSGITYTTGGSTHEIYQYDPLLSTDEGDAAIPVVFDTGWLDPGGELLKLLKMVQITVLNEDGIDSALTLRFAADYSTDTDTLTPLRTQGTERCIFLYDPSGDVEGQYFKLGFTDTSFGLKELTQIMAQFKTGRTAFIHKNFDDVVDESYVAPSPPVISSLTPDSAEPGDGAFTMTITGTGFNVDSIAYWNGEQRVTTFVSPTELEVAITADDVADEGDFDVTVMNVVGGESAPATFEVAGGFTRVTFTGDDTWVVPVGVTEIDILVVAQGGDTDQNSDGVFFFWPGGGGGGGGVLVVTGVPVTPGETIEIFPDSGIVRAQSGSLVLAQAGLAGIGGYEVNGGVGNAGNGASQSAPSGGTIAAGSRGGGGGGGGWNFGGQGAGGTGSNSAGDGGNSSDADGNIDENSSGGGGGAGENGQAGTDLAGGAGGDGIVPPDHTYGPWGTDIGENGYFGGGGGGIRHNVVDDPYGGTPAANGLGNGAPNTGGGATWASDGSKIAARSGFAAIVYAG